MWQAARGFADVMGGNGVLIPEVFDDFGPQLNAFMTVGFCRRKLLQFEWSKSVEIRYVLLYITDQVVFRCFFYKNFTLPQPKFHICWRYISSFSKTQQNEHYLDIFAYSSVLEFQSFSPLPRHLRRYRQSLSRSKSLNCKQRLMFHQEPIN